MMRSNKLSIVLYFIFGFVLFIVTLSYQQDDPYFDIYADGYSPILGIWEVYDSENIPFEHISFCEDLGIGTKFAFDYIGRIFVYKNNRKKYCNHDQNYYYQDSVIVVSEYDVTFRYKIEILRSDTLIINYYNRLKLKRIFEPL